MPPTALNSDTHPLSILLLLCFHLCFHYHLYSRDSPRINVTMRTFLFPMVVSLLAVLAHNSYASLSTMAVYCHEIPNEQHEE